VLEDQVRKKIIHDTGIVDEKVDRLRGFKENVIMGHLIPAGTGFPQHREIKLVELGEQIDAPVMEEAEAQPAIG